MKQVLEMLVGFFFALAAVFYIVTLKLQVTNMFMAVILMLIGAACLIWAMLSWGKFFISKL